MVDRDDRDRDGLDDEDAYDFGDGLDQPAPPIGAEPPQGPDDFDDSFDEGPPGAAKNVDLNDDVFDELGDTDDIERADESEQSNRRVVMIIGAVVLLGLIGAAGALTVLLGQGDPPPIIRAEAGPIKTPPAEDGGLEVPFQDSLVLNRPQDEPEVLMRRPPEPLSPTPLPAPSAEAQANAEPLSPLTPPSLFGTGGSDPTPEATPQTGPTAADIERELGVLSAGQAPAPTPARERPPAPRDLTLETSQPAGGADAAAAAPAAPAPRPERPQTAAATPEPAPTPAPAAASGGGDGWRVQLASLRSRAAAERGWANLRNRAPDLLNGQPLTIEQARVSGSTYFRVQAGDFGSRSDANGLCQQLKARGLDCIVTR